MSLTHFISNVKRRRDVLFIVDRDTILKQFEKCADFEIFNDLFCSCENPFFGYEKTPQCIRSYSTSTDQHAPLHNLIRIFIVNFVIAGRSRNCEQTAFVLIRLHNYAANLEKVGSFQTHVDNVDIFKYQHRSSVIQHSTYFIIEPFQLKILQCPWT